MGQCYDKKYNVNNGNVTMLKVNVNSSEYHSSLKQYNFFAKHVESYLSNALDIHLFKMWVEITCHPFFYSYRISQPSFSTRFKQKLMLSNANNKLTM